MSVEVEVTYSSAEVRRLAGITYRQLDYWCRTGVLDPGWRDQGGRIIDDEGSGQLRRFTAAELVKAQAMAQMLADGVSFQHAKGLIRHGYRLVCAVFPLPQAPEVGVAGVAAAGEAGAGRGTPAAPAGTRAATPATSIPSEPAEAKS